jgi:protoheme IX farnesyltransferase
MSTANQPDVALTTQSASRMSLAGPGDYFALLKPRVMSLVVFTALVGLVLAPGAINLVVAVISVLCIAIGAGASGALNMWYDADIDAIMTRTRSRPVPSGKIEADGALAFGLVLSVLSVMTLGLVANWLSAAILAFTIFFYAVIYTMYLKRSTPQNIVIGGAAGAFPPMIGWAVVTNSVSVESVVLFAIIFFWTPPHFWALALFKARDYGAAGVPMLPNVAGEPATKRQILAYSLVLGVVGLLPTVLGFASLVYGAIAALLGAQFIYLAWRVMQMPDGDRAMVPAKKLFAYSIFYLFALFAVLLVEGTITRIMPWIGS